VRTEFDGPGKAMQSERLRAAGRQDDTPTHRHRLR
jgi:hypothetical protein